MKPNNWLLLSIFYYNYMKLYSADQIYRPQSCMQRPYRVIIFLMWFIDLKTAIENFQSHCDWNGVEGSNLRALLRLLPIVAMTTFQPDSI